MNTQSDHNVNFFESQMDIGVSKPYAVISAYELTAVIRRFVSWAAIVAKQPNLREILGDASTAHIKLATDLRAAIKKSVKEGFYPNVVLPIRKFTTTMTLLKVSRALESEIGGIIVYESQRWEEEYQLLR